MNPHQNAFRKCLGSWEGIIYVWVWPNQLIYLLSMGCEMSATHRHIDTICAYYGLYRPSDLPLKNTHVALASISQPHFGKHEHMLSLWWHLIYIQPKSFFYVEIEIIIVENADSYFFWLNRLDIPAGLTYWSISFYTCLRRIPKNKWTSVVLI